MKKKLIISGILFILIGISAYFVVNYYITASDQNSQTVEVANILDSRFEVLGGKTDKDLDLPVYLPFYSDLKISWSSSKPNIISEDGVVNRPVYVDGDAEVILTASIESKVEGFKLQMMSLLGYKKTSYVINIIVKSLEATDEEKMSLTINDLIVPRETSRDINLLKKSSVFNDISIEWSSSDSTILSENGLIKGYGDVLLTAKVSIGDKSNEKIFSVTVTDEEISYLVLDEDFASYVEGDYNTPWVSNDNLFKVTEGKIVNIDSKKALSLNATNFGSLEFLNGNYEGIFSLSYEYGDELLIGENIYLKIYQSIHGNPYRVVETIDISDITNNVLTYNFTNYEHIKISFESDNDSLLVNVLNIVIKHYLSEENIVNSLEDLIPRIVTESINLPTTTIYGGSVIWESSHPEIISFEGVVNVPLTQTTVTLTAIISYFEDDITYAISISVGEGGQLPSVFVYFIDVGKYGESDCGEAMMIQVGDYEVMIDAGDRYNDSTKAVLEAVNNISRDKIIELAIATHPHSDHIGSMDDIFYEFDVINLLQFEGSHTSGVYSDYVAAYEASGCNVCTVMDAYNNIGECRRVIEISSNVTIEIINTGYYNDSDLNSKSIIFVLEAYGKRVLFTGDADNNIYPLEASYMDYVGDIDILKVVHHGAKNGTTTAFLQAVTPEVAIITNGNYLGNKNGHPTSEVINRIYANNNKTQIYALTGGNADECTLGTSYKCVVTDRFHQRNGTMIIEITGEDYYISSEYNSGIPIELSSTDFWVGHPSRLYSYIN